MRESPQVRMTEWYIKPEPTNTLSKTHPSIVSHKTFVQRLQENPVILENPAHRERADLLFKHSFQLARNLLYQEDMDFNTDALTFTTQIPMTEAEIKEVSTLQATIFPHESAEWHLEQSNESGTEKLKKNEVVQLSLAKYDGYHLTPERQREVVTISIKDFNVNEFITLTRNGVGTYLPHFPIFAGERPENYLDLSKSLATLLRRLTTPEKNPNCIKEIVTRVPKPEPALANTL